MQSPLLVLSLFFLSVLCRSPYHPYTVPFSSCPCADISLCQALTVGPRQEIYLFQITQDYWQDYDWALTTTIALFEDLDPNLLCYAHQHNVRIVFKADVDVSQLSNSTWRDEWVNSLLELTLDSYTDGINVDMETAIAADSPEQQYLTQLMNQLQTTFNQKVPGSQITFDIPWSPDCIDGRCYDWIGLAENTDFLFVMDYDTRSQIFDLSDCIAAANSPIQLVKDGMKNFTKLGISPDQLVIGVPWYGYDYTCISYENTTCYIEPVSFRGAPCSDAAGVQHDYRMIKQLLYQNSTTGRQWDEESQTPWFNYVDQNGALHQVWYDDPASLAIKYAFGQSMGLRGAGMWNADSLDYDTTDPQLTEETQVMWDQMRTYLIDFS